MISEPPLSNRKIAKFDPGFGFHRSKSEPGFDFATCRNHSALAVAPHTKAETSRRTPNLSPAGCFGLFSLKC